MRVAAKLSAASLRVWPPAASLHTFSALRFQLLLQSWDLLAACCPPAGKGDELPGRPAQDLVFVVRQKAHPVFEREGDDLVAKLRIPIRWVPPAIMLLLSAAAAVATQRDSVQLEPTWQLAAAATRRHNAAVPLPACMHTAGRGRICCIGCLEPMPHVPPSLALLQQGAGRRHRGCSHPGWQNAAGAPQGGSQARLRARGGGRRWVHLVCLHVLCEPWLSSRPDVRSLICPCLVIAVASVARTHPEHATACPPPPAPACRLPQQQDGDQRQPAAAL